MTTQPRDAAVHGIMLAAAGYSIIACADAAVKWVLPQVGVAGVLLWRGVVGAMVVAILFRGRVWPKNRRVVFGRSILHATVAIIWYVAWMRGVGLADSYAVAALAPIMMTLLAIPMLGETVGWRRALSCGVGFCGTLVMLQPGGSLWRWEALMLIVAVVGMAVSRVLTRVLARTDTAAAAAFWLMAAHIPLGLLALPFFEVPVSLLPTSWGSGVALLLFGCANAMAHILFARAYGLAPVGALAPLEYTVLPFGAVLGYFLFSEIPAWTTWLGASIVVGAGIYNLHRERVRARERRAAAA
jgi:drug/metabolite transporter (DMT)-like permease